MLSEEKLLKVFLAEDEVIVREALRDSIPWEQHGFVFILENHKTTPPYLFLNINSQLFIITQKDRSAKQSIFLSGLFQNKRNLMFHSKNMRV